MSILHNCDLVMKSNESYINRWVPCVTEESSNGYREIHLLTKQFNERKIFIVGDITAEMANDFVSKMLYLSKSNEPVDIYINSNGGSINAGLVIYDVIQACKFPVNLYCIGMAASMAALVLAGGQKGRRYILPHSKVMIHEPLVQGGLEGSASSLKKTAESIIEIKKLTNSILAKHTGKSMDEIDKATSFDNFMNSKEAIDFGICDAIRNII